MSSGYIQQISSNVIEHDARFKRREWFIVTFFYAASVGKGIRATEEFCLLVEWSDAIEAAIWAALSARDHRSDAEYCAMQDECNRYLDMWRADERLAA